MPKFIAPHPMIFNGKLRDVINLEKLSSFTYMKAAGNNYGYIRFCFDKGNDHLWAYADDAALMADVSEIYGMLGLEAGPE
ncbi:hypothetical protein [Taibaiella koreensis]|uniref:hypothetical protein n=1 Tax=Taibaiella koreensis TaxID=1268548 RepID=UPI0013C2CE06|nr:hypothetical protein [Taibaiella koreensis]